MCAHALLPLMQQAPNGYPCKNAIKTVLMQLHKEFDILKLTQTETQKNYSIFEKCEKAADAWKVMAKHCLDLKHAGKPVGGNLQAVLDIMQASQVTFATEAGIEAAPLDSEHAHVDAASTSPATPPATHVVAAEWSPIPTVPATHVVAAGFSSYELEAYVPQLLVEPPPEADAIPGLLCQCPECMYGITVCSSEEEWEQPPPDPDELEIQRKHNESYEWYEEDFGEDEEEEEFDEDEEGVGEEVFGDSQDGEMDGCWFATCDWFLHHSCICYRCIYK